MRTINRHVETMLNYKREPPTFDVEGLLIRLSLTVIWVAATSRGPMLGTLESSVQYHHQNGAQISENNPYASIRMPCWEALVQEL